jgi:AhpC/TSA family protein
VSVDNHIVAGTTGAPSSRTNMSKIIQKLELVTNVLILIVTIAIAGVLVRKFVFPPPPPRAELPGLKTPTIGSKVGLAGLDWSQSHKNVLLVLQKDCRFCTDSAPFYRDLIKQTEGRDVKVVAVLPQSDEEAKKYLHDLNITGIEVKQSSLTSLEVGGTPTIVIADDNGTITDVWFGRLQPDKENEVLAKLTG